MFRRWAPWARSFGALGPCAVGFFLPDGDDLDQDVADRDPVAGLQRLRLGRNSIAVEQYAVRAAEIFDRERAVSSTIQAGVATGSAFRVDVDVAAPAAAQNVVTGRQKQVAPATAHAREARRTMACIRWIGAHNAVTNGHDFTGV